jgi:NAD(P)-dependent dehydrogenase (short-subunit alcohol dehydrogenase family)
VTRSKLVLVTGATSGIGAAVGQALAAAGVRVLLVGRNPRKLAAAARGLPAGRGTPALADLRSTEDIRRLVSETAQRYARLDALVHCAGEYDWSEPGSLECNSFDVMFAVNVRAPYLLTQGLARQLARARGQVIFLNSSIVRSSGRGLAAYKATQHALQGLTDSLREDLNGRRVRVSSLFAGRTATPRMRRIYAREGTPYTPRRLLSAADVGQLVLALLQLPPRIEVTDLHLRSLTPY